MGHNRWVAALVVTLLSVVVPVLIVIGALVVRPTSMLELGAVVLAACAWMALLALVNRWEFTSLALRWVWLGALAGALALRAQHIPPLTRFASVTPLAAVAMALGALGLWLIGGALSARRHDRSAIDLSFPLSSGRFLVAEGGDGARSWLVNDHYGFGQGGGEGDRYTMRYALDLVETTLLGGEARGFLPSDPERYRIWDRPLLAPCDGLIVHAENTVDDNPGWGADQPHDRGNHVVIRVEDTYVVVGHLRRGTVAVAEGDHVRAGDEIGRAGNSGGTERPHVHLQAMRTADADWWQGEPVAVRFNGRFLVRNDVVRAAGS